MAMRLLPTSSVLAHPVLPPLFVANFEAFDPRSFSGLPTAGEPTAVDFAADVKLALAMNPKLGIRVCDRIAFASRYLRGQAREYYTSLLARWECACGTRWSSRVRTEEVQKWITKGFFPCHCIGHPGGVPEFRSLDNFLEALATEFPPPPLIDEDHRLEAVPHELERELST